MQYSVGNGGGRSPTADTTPPEETPAMFTVGVKLLSRQALQMCVEHGVNPDELLLRHVAGDFGEADQETRTANLAAIGKGEGRIVSWYRLGAGDNESVVVVTKSDWKRTAIVTPDELERALRK